MDGSAGAMAVHEKQLMPAVREGGSLFELRILQIAWLPLSRIPRPTSPPAASTPHHVRAPSCRQRDRDRERERERDIHTYIYIYIYILFIYLRTDR